MSDKKQPACKILIQEIVSGKIKNNYCLENRKIELAREHKLGSIPKNAKILAHVSEKDKNYAKLKKFLQIKPVRTGSGVANVAVMWSGECLGECIYCPSVTGIPKSYTGHEPASMRAKRNKFDAYAQVQNRLKQLKLIGHPIDKCELIVMGGNFLIETCEKRNKFVKECLRAFDESNAKVIGLTFETRPDFCTKENVEWMMSAGATRVEIGVQSTDDDILNKVKRGHGTKAVKDTTKLLKDYGLKVCYHWMPGLTGINGKVDAEKEVSDFDKLFSDPDYRPDELKIYPTLVIPGTELYEKWRKNLFQAMTPSQTATLLIKLKERVPEYVRIKRIMRDIPENLVEQGPSTTNLRQLILERMLQTGKKCRCIRCREIRTSRIDKTSLEKLEYIASGEREIFLSYVSNDKIIGFMRLRLLDDRVLVRELHVYGPMAEIGSKGVVQHHAFGRKLLGEVEQIAKSSKVMLVQVTSGIGAREYYEKLGYELSGFYMIKRL
ncbi:MAG: tRNA uridine(34) 5-carboxymethylaminomethyl modification radical SAM/GNAT enzyme Elp3 [Candidatus Aenigmatarchaeota archaeon]